MIRVDQLPEDYLSTKEPPTDWQNWQTQNVAGDFPLFRIEAADGRHRIVHHYPEASAIMMLLYPNYDTVLVEQFRFGINAWTLEFPRGAAKTGETIIDCVIRESQEETGILVAENTINLMGKINADSGTLSLSPNAALVKLTDHELSSHFDDYAVTRSYRVPLHLVGSLIRQGNITDGYTLATMQKACLVDPYIANYTFNPDIRPQSAP